MANLIKKLNASDHFTNPPIVVPSKDYYVVLDGATRVSSFKKLGYPHIIVQILKDKGFSFSLRDLIQNSVTQFGGESDQERSDLIENVYRFLQNRIAHLLAEDGYSKDTVAAVLNVSCDNIPQTWSRVGALEKLKAKPDFEPLAVAFKPS